VSTSADRDVQQIRPFAWVWWAFVGMMVGLGIAGLLTIGAVLLAVALVMTIAGSRSPRLRNRSASMVLAGAAAAPLFMAWLNRAGPGTVCQVSGSVTSCTDETSPWPFVVVAVVLVVTGAAVARWGQRRSRGATAPAGG
jgi:hypothetical protein